jgi:hypothetical protein
MSEIKINPLNGLVQPEKRKKVPRPKWMCRHEDAILVDRNNMIYKCSICNPTNQNIKVIPNVSLTKTSPKKVTVSPGKSECQSPKGFS